MTWLFDQEGSSSELDDMMGCAMAIFACFVLAVLPLVVTIAMPCK